MNPTTVAGRLLDQLAALGVDVVFGLPGVHNLPFWDAAADDGARRPRIVGVRHEQAAVYAADSLARATGRLQVALTTTGPGAANAVAAFGEAASVRSPVLLLASEAPLRSRRTSGVDAGLLHSMADQAALFSTPFDAFTLSFQGPGDASHLLPTVAQVLTSIPGPGYVGIPADVLGMPADESVQEVGDFYLRRPDLAPAVPEPADVDHLARLVADRRVVIWAGPECLAAQDELQTVAERLAAPVVATYQARGLMAGHPLLVDAPPQEPEVAALVGGADVLLVLGDELHGMTTRNWTMPLPPVVAAVTRYSGLSLGDLDLALRLDCEVGATLRALAEQLPPEPPAAWAPADLRTSVLGRLDVDPRTTDAVAFLQAVHEGGAAYDVVVADMCVAGYWLGGYAAAVRPRRQQYPVGWGTLGYGLPAAIGPGAAGIRTLAVVGDGGAAMSLGELATYRQEDLPVTLLVVDDGGYGMLRFDQQAFGHPVTGVDLVGPDWEALAAAYRIPARPTSLASLADDLAAAAAVEGPTLLHLVAAFTPPRTTSPRWHEG